MASETYYYFFSLIAVFIFLFHIMNMVFYRVKHKTMLGDSYAPGSQEYKKLAKYSGGVFLSLAALVELLFVVNLVYDINRILKLGKPEYAHFILPFAPIFVIVIFGVVFNSMRNMYKGKK